jgi:hypothetical protein
MSGGKSLLAAGIVTVVWALSACSGSPASTPAQPGAGGPATETNPPGDIPDNQAFVAFTPSGGGFSVKIPEGWSSATAGSTTTFTDKLNQIEVEAVPAAAPTVASITATDVPALTARVPRFTLGGVSTVSRSGGPVVLVTYQGDSPVDPVTGKVVRDAFERYVFFRAGTQVNVTVSGPVDADNVDPWRIVTDSFQWR